MITKNINTIELPDIQNLVDNQVLEGKTLEYKSAIPGNGDEDKKEFLADISSFANTDGGDLIFGIFENKKEVDKEFGLENINKDGEIQRLESIIRDGISPRIEVDIRVIDVDDKKSVLLIRIKPSLNGPHRVVFKNSNRFFRRNSNGKYEMDVHELKNAFIKGSNLVDRIRIFRKNRIFELKANNGPVKLKSSDSFIAVHIIPLSGVIDENKLTSKQLLELKEHKIDFRPLYSSGWNTRINLDGVCAYSPGDGFSSSYSQIFRNGTIEGFNSLMIAHGADTRIIPMIAIERELIKFIQNNLDILKKLEIEPPYFIFISLIGVKGFLIKTGNWLLDSEEIGEEDICLPEVILNDFEDDVPKTLRPAFDMVWNASGNSRSYGYDDNGELIKFN